MKRLTIPAVLVAMTLLLVESTKIGGHTVVPSPNAREVSYTFADIEVPFPGAAVTRPYSINNSGQIVGSYQAGGVFYGFIADAGEFTTIDVPFTFGTTTKGINASGQIVGTYSANNRAHCFLLDGEVFSTINVSFLGALWVDVNGINARGQIVGNYRDPSLEGHGYLLSEGQFTTIDVPFPGATGTVVYGINARGQMVGSYSDSVNGPQAFLVDQGKSNQASVFSRIHLPFADIGTSYARGISDRGQIVGFYSDASMHQHGFLIDRGGVSKIDVPGALNTQLTGINDRGEIVGIYFQGDATSTRGFIATPYNTK